MDILAGGSRRRLTKYRANLARSLETIRRHRTPEEAERFIALYGYTSPLNHRYDWMGNSNHGLSGCLNARSEKGERVTSVSAPLQMVEGWRDVGDADDIIRLRHTGWYADTDGSRTYVPHVWQLPARKGNEQYVAGYMESDGGDRAASGYCVLEHDGAKLVIYDTKEDAAHAANRLAEDDAEEAREYDGRWQEASRADVDRDIARTELAEARAEAANIIDAWREQRAVGPLTETVCTVLRKQVADARRDMRKAITTINRMTANINALGMKGEF